MSANRKQGLCADKRGAGAVEFAMVAPAFLLLVFGSLQVAVALHNGGTVQWAIERASRAAALNANITETALQDLVDANLELVGKDIPVDVSYTTVVGTEMTLGRITGSYVHPVSFLFLPPMELNFATDVTVPLPIASPAQSS